MAGLTKEQRAERARIAVDIALGWPVSSHADAPAATVATVAMVRDSATNPKPHAADVHPDEVENYKAGGWMVKPQEAA